MFNKYDTLRMNPDSVQINITNNIRVKLKFLCLYLHRGIGNALKPVILVTVKMIVKMRHHETSRL